MVPSCRSICADRAPTRMSNVSGCAKIGAGVADQAAPVCRSRTKKKSPSSPESRWLVRKHSRAFRYPFPRAFRRDSKAPFERQYSRCGSQGFISVRSERDQMLGNTGSHRDSIAYFDRCFNGLLVAHAKEAFYRKTELSCCI